MRTVSLVTLAALVILVAVAAEGQKDPPRMLIRDSNADLGTFLEGVDIDYSFIVRNTGVSELHLLSVRPG